ncbi:hypothetical protein Ahy_A10g047084 [Arachis hypogaea]|uniref:Cell number regulator n=1 Tax=Arachis hypogaea TaxID=3818 RepID=A0A445B1K3_ARAHY|nr:hypothetical protein Ahy_A10g047084 [Arachis hypogaea]
MDERNELHYVKLTRDQSPLEDITPGELNQPIDVPQLAVRKCIECGQPLPESYAPPADEAWTTGIFGCAEDNENCMTGLNEETPWTGPCICHAIFIEGGAALAAITTIFNGYIDPGTAFLIYEGLLFSWWMCGIYTGQVRQTLQKKYHLKNSPCDPCCVHCWLHWCALCQEHREMKGRLSDNIGSEITIVNPPPIQEMKTTNNANKEKAEPSSTRNNNNDHTGLELQVVNI